MIEKYGIQVDNGTALDEVILPKLVFHSVQTSAMLSANLFGR